MEADHSQAITSLLEKQRLQLIEKERNFLEQKEELESQKEELTAAIEELVAKNNSLSAALTELSRRNSELDQILYRASHDLKTPVTSMQGLLSLMARDSMNSGQMEVHQHLLRQLQQMSQTLRSFTMLSEASFGQLKIEMVDSASVIEQIWSRLGEIHNLSRLSLDLPSSCPTIHTDANLFDILAECLLSNAITFRPSPVGTVEVAFWKNDSETIIEIADDGEGIPIEANDRIFEMFFRASPRSRGSGLGLYIVKIIVDRLKGQIAWQRNSGRTSFQVILPESLA